MGEARHPNHPGELSTEAPAAERLRDGDELEARARAIQVVQAAGIPFLVGGAYAYAHFTGIYRDTKDLDLFLLPEDVERTLEVLARDGWRTEHHPDGWLAKGFKGDYFVDLIFSSGNGVAVVDADWFAHAVPGRVFGQDVLLVPAEEMIWSKSFVMERERFDGADVSHLLRGFGGRLDWDRLLRRFERYWEVLLGHLMFFRFAYPSDRDLVPDRVMTDLLSRTVETLRSGADEERVCRGDLLSGVNYRLDVDSWGYASGRERDEQERGGTGGTRSEIQGPGGSVR
ncbi:MAG TPA: nucleotidyltransferase family protein [Myxococcaceae bacterium]|nr:nucleotidyltransferase family protein [Myxococcaceae bacterium]